MTMMMGEEITTTITEVGVALPTSILVKQEEDFYESFHWAIKIITSSKKKKKIRFFRSKKNNPCFIFQECECQRTYLQKTKKVTQCLRKKGSPFYLEVGTRRSADRRHMYVCIIRSPQYKVF